MFEERFTSITYRTPRFEDITVGGADRASERCIIRAEEGIKQTKEAIEESQAWIDLLAEMRRTGAKTVADLPKDRQAYWKHKLQKPTQARFF